MPAPAAQGPADRLADPQPTAAGGWRFLGGPVDPRAIARAGARLLRPERFDRAAAARRAAGRGDPRRARAPAPHRPRRHGGRQRRAAAGLAAGGGFPRRPCRLSAAPALCDEGWRPAPAANSSAAPARRPEPDLGGGPPVEGTHDQHRHRLGRAHARSAASTAPSPTPRRTSSAPPPSRRRSSAPGVDADEVSRDHPRPGADRRPGPEPGAPGAHRRRPAGGQRRLGHQPGLRLGPARGGARRPAHHARRRRHRRRRRPGEHVAVARTAPICAPGRRWAT